MRTGVLIFAATPLRSVAGHLVDLLPVLGSLESESRDFR
jgi:hypothetical protein